MFSYACAEQAGPGRHVFRSAVFAGILTAACATGFGQKKPQTIRPQVYQIPKNGIFDSRTKTTTPDRVPIGRTVPAARREVSPAMKRRILQMAARVDAASANAFQRGLMDLDDFGMHQDTVFRLRLAARGNEGGKDRSAQLRARIRRFDAAAEWLRRFRQPGSAGWEASLAQARLMATNARIDLAIARKDRTVAPLLSEKSIELSKQFYYLRKRDYDAGLADDRKMAKALAETLGKTNTRQRDESISQPSDRVRAALAQRVARDSLLAKRPAGNARPDRLAEARFHLAESRALVALANRKPADSLTALMHADRESRAQFQQLGRFSQTKTASLFDMTRSWMRRDQLQRAITHGGIELPADMLATRRADLNHLRSAATSVKDPRGRNAADVALVEGLQLLEVVQPIRVVRKTTSGTAPSKSKPGVTPRVIDLTPLRSANRSSKIATRGETLLSIPLNGHEPE